MKRDLSALPIVVVLLTAVAGRNPLAAAADTEPWMFQDLHLRVPLTVNAGIYPRQNALVSWQVDFIPLLRSAGAVGRFDPNSR